jgi:hypothetical protein
MGGMGVGEIDPAAREVWAQTRLHIWPEEYVVASLPRSALVAAAAAVGGAPGFMALVAERDEVSITLTEEAWRTSGLAARASAEAGPYRVITLDVNIDLAVVGYLAPAALRLAEARIAIVPQCAFLKDHLLVREADLEIAVRVLEGLVGECRGRGALSRT